MQVYIYIYLHLPRCGNFQWQVKFVQNCLFTHLLLWGTFFYVDDRFWTVICADVVFERLRNGLRCGNSVCQLKFSCFDSYRFIYVTCETEFWNLKSDDLRFYPRYYIQPSSQEKAKFKESTWIPVLFEETKKVPELKKKTGQVRISYPNELETTGLHLYILPKEV